MNATVRAAIGLGSNLGDRKANLHHAIAGLDRYGSLIAVSSLYETAPVGGPEQGDYLNAVVLLDTTASPGELLSGVLAIEASLDRVRDVRWGPRTIDLDILLYGEDSVDEPGLTVPHPELLNRRFVLEPLLEVWPDACLPDGSPLRPRLSEVSDQPVQRLGSVWGRAAVLGMVAVVVAAAVLMWWAVGRVL